MKLFNDSVHKQIFIPKKYCNSIIDTEAFQRLKRVEQTCASFIFPTATHNRFVHSLGVFHVGKLLFDAIEKNTRARSPEIRERFNISKVLDCFCCVNATQRNNYEILRESFQVACLLHDCGHAPFSHTFEGFYTQNDAGDRLIGDIIEAVGKIKSAADSNKHLCACCEEFIADMLRARNNPGSKPHEYVSAWLILQTEGFYTNITKGKLCADPLLAARMILGVPYKTKRFRKKKKELRQILNCYIGLLNGHLIDADRIDYAYRDQWAMGVTTSSFNLARLLSSIFIGKRNDEFCVIYAKKALTELQSLTETKNFSNFWVFNHHKVKFLESELINAVTYLAVLLANKQEDYDKIANQLHEHPEIKEELEDNIHAIENEAMGQLFDYETLIKGKIREFHCNSEAYKEFVFRLSDDDIFSLLKRYFSQKNAGSPLMVAGNEAYINLITRGQSYVPIWKSYVEYVSHFSPTLFHHLKGLNLEEEHKDSIRMMEDNSADTKLDFCWSMFRVALEKNFLRNEKQECLSPYKKVDVSSISINGLKKLGAQVYVEVANQILTFGNLPIPHKTVPAAYDSFFYLYIKSEVFCKDKENISAEETSEWIEKRISTLTKDDVQRVLSKSNL